MWQVREFGVRGDGGSSLAVVHGRHGGVAFASGRSYQAIIEFPRACGITVGTPVRIRGVRVGQAVAGESNMRCCCSSR